MTTWKYLLGLLLFLSLSSPSEGHCKDYFDVEGWKSNLTETIHLIATGSLKDQMECASESQCLQSGKNCHIFHHCFNRTDKKKSKKCEGDTPESVFFYDYMCLTAKAIGHSVPHCNYTLVCKLYTQGRQDVCLKTTPLISLTTTTMSTWPELAPTTAASAPAETPTTATTHITTDAIHGDKSNRNASQEKEDLHKGPAWMQIVTIVLIISLILNAILLCTVVCLWRQKNYKNTIIFFEKEPMMDSRREEPVNERTSV